MSDYILVIKGGPKVRTQYTVYKLLYTHFWPTLYFIMVSASKVPGDGKLCKVGLLLWTACSYFQTVWVTATDKIKL
jgi:hypothetical protein